MAKPTAVQVASFLGQGEDANVVALAEVHLPLITEMARTHTRGVGFNDNDEPNDAISAVIVTATARLVSNPTSLQSSQAGPMMARHTVFQGWTLIELSVLDGHRRKAA